MANELRIQGPATPIVRGQTATVEVTLVLDRPLKVRGIHAKFHGAEETKADYVVTTSDGKGQSQTQIQTAVQHVDITTRAHLIAGNERLGFLGNVSDAIATVFGGGQHETMKPGEYKFEIEVAVPEDAPPTHVGKRSRVFYEISAHVDVPAGYDLKAKESLSLETLPVTLTSAPVRTKYPDDAGRGFFDSLVTPDVEIEMALVADKVRVGDAINGFFCLMTPKPLSCKAVRVRLVGIETSEAEGHSDRFVHKSEALELARPGVIDEMFKHEFSLAADMTAPTSRSGKLFSIQWFVEVELDVPWAKDPKIRAPISIYP